LYPITESPAELHEGDAISAADLEETDFPPRADKPGFDLAANGTGTLLELIEPAPAVGEFAHDIDVVHAMMAVVASTIALPRGSLQEIAMKMHWINRSCDHCATAPHPRISGARLARSGANLSLNPAIKESAK